MPPYTPRRNPPTYDSSYTVSSDSVYLNRRPNDHVLIDMENFADPQPVMPLTAQQAAEDIGVEEQEEDSPPAYVLGVMDSSSSDSSSSNNSDIGNNSDISDALLIDFDVVPPNYEEIFPIVQVADEDGNDDGNNDDSGNTDDLVGDFVLVDFEDDVSAAFL